MTYVIEAIYDGGPILNGREDQRWECETVEEAAQIFESEANVPASMTLSRIVEDLHEGKVEHHDWERCMTLVAYEVELAGVSC
jgi:hypothetical protein